MTLIYEILSQPENFCRQMSDDVGDGPFLEVWVIKFSLPFCLFFFFIFQSVAGVPQRIASKMTSRTNGVPAQNHTLKTGEFIGEICKNQEIKFYYSYWALNLKIRL